MSIELTRGSQTRMVIECRCKHCIMWDNVSGKCLNDLSMYFNTVVEPNNKCEDFDPMLN